MKNSLTLLLFLSAVGAHAQEDLAGGQGVAGGSGAVIEIRSYNLKPGARAYFNRLFVEQCLPMLGRWKVQVLGYGPSLHDTDSYFLVRGFESVQAREKAEDAFYGSDEWKKGPREDVLAQIVSYTTIVLPVDAVGALATRAKTREEHSLSDSARLSALNRQFIQNFLHQDVKKHNEIIHPDFVCIESDGSIVNREEYLKNWATDFQRSGYQSFDYKDESIRIFHDMALVRARTVFTRRGGQQGSAIYTDTYVREHGQWQCVQAQLTPVK